MSCTPGVGFGAGCRNQSNQSQISSSLWALMRISAWNRRDARRSAAVPCCTNSAYPGAVRHVFLLLSVIALATALTVLTGVASGAGPEQGTVVLVKLELKASNGLHAHLENSEDGTVTLELRKEGQIATYKVPGEATEGGLKARFGRLGLIDVAFTPTKMLNSTEPGRGCTGPPRTLREGVFIGTIDFTGEREFVRIEGSQAIGSMSVISEWECPEAEAMDPFARVSRLSEATSRDEKGKGESATLAAVRRGFSSYFVAGVAHRHSGGERIFFGAKIEKRGGMGILRAAGGRGPGLALRLQPRCRHGSVAPTGPFQRTRELRGPSPQPRAVAKHDPGAAARGQSDQHWRPRLQGDPPSPLPVLTNTHRSGRARGWPAFAAPPPSFRFFRPVGWGTGGRGWPAGSGASPSQSTSSAPARRRAPPAQAAWRPARR